MAAALLGIPCDLPAQEAGSRRDAAAAFAGSGTRGTVGDTLRAYRLGSVGDSGGAAAGEGREAPEDLVRLDGRLSEPFWQRADRITSLRQREPDEGEAGTERTEVRVVYGAETLYVGIRAFDAEPDAVVGRILQRDRLMRVERGEELRFTGDDAVAVLFDPFHDHRNGIVFATNANGAQFEALVTDEGGDINVDWRGVWQVEATRTDDGWSAEMAIPFRSLRYPEGAGPDQPWGFNVFRMIQRKQEQLLWQSWSREGGGFLRVSQAGHLTGLSRLPSHGIDIEAKPYVLGRRSGRAGPDGGLTAAHTGELGLDLKAEPRPGLVLDLTYNTDFAQVEVDEVQVNLSRFSLFFPEKRDFFLENAGVFNLGVPGGGMGPPPFLLFFSRRIGLAGGDPIPIHGGARLTGRVGGQTVGLMNVTTAGTGEEPRTNFGVARVKRDVGANSYVGALVTDRRTVGGVEGIEDADPDAYNSAGGVDANYWINERLNVQGFLAGSRTSGAGGDGHAFRGAVRYDSDRFGVEVQHLTISPEMTARSGFITRKDIRQHDGFARFSPRPDLLGIRRMDIGMPFEVVHDTGGRLLDWRIGNFFGVSWNSGDRLEAFSSLSEVTVREDFELGDSIPIATGVYDNSWIQTRFQSSPARSVGVQATGRYQQKFGGRQITLGGRLSVQPLPQLALEAGYRRDDVETPNGAFVAHIGRLRADVALSTRLTTNVFVQYNSLAEDLLTNVRFNFIHSPGSDLFLVLTEERGRPDDPWSVEDRDLVAKLTYLYRF